MNKVIERFKQLDRMILDELNVKVISRVLIKFNGKRKLTLTFDGEEYYFAIDGKRTKKNYDDEYIIEILKKVYE